MGEVGHSGVGHVSRVVIVVTVPVLELTPVQARPSGSRVPHIR